VTEARSAVFVSHASEDAEAARRLCELLGAAGIEVWLDQSELRGGDAWDTMIRGKIRGCALFVALMSSHTRARSEGYFRLEWKLAIDRSYHIASDRPFLLPIAIDDTRDCDARVPDRFREVQWTYAPRGEPPPEFLERVRRMLETAAGGGGAATSAEVGVWSDSLPEKSLAVMPFANLSRDPENEYFSDGLAEEILNALSGVTELRVAARSSSFYFKGRTTELQEIAQRLRVAHVVEGSVRRVGNRLRVTAQLVDVRNGFQLWSEGYDRELADVFEIQDEIARAIAGRLKVALLGGARRPTSNLEAYELYLRGRHEWAQRTPTSVRTAVQYFERCIALDADYALAHAGLVGCYGLLPFQGALSQSAARARAEIAVRRTMELDPGLWECYYARALYSMFFEGNWRDAEHYIKRALEINLRDPMLNAHYALLLAVVGREAETVRYAETACKLDPLAAHVLGLGAHAMKILGKFTECEALARNAIQLQPEYRVGRVLLGFALGGLGRHEEAVATVERVVSESTRPVDVGYLGLAYGLAGRHGDAARMLRQLEERAMRGELSVGLARLVLMLGSNDCERVRAAFIAALADGAGAYHIKVAGGPYFGAYRCDPEVDRLHRQLYGW
jgi:TolB-like protein